MNSLLWFIKTRKMEGIGSCCMTVLGMSLRKVISLGSNLASVTDLTTIQTLHSLCCNFGGY